MGALLRGIKREQISRGQAIIAPGTMKSIRKFQAAIYVLTKDEGEGYQSNVSLLMIAHMAYNDSRRA